MKIKRSSILFIKLIFLKKKDKLKKHKKNNTINKKNINIKKLKSCKIKRYLEIILLINKKKEFNKSFKMQLKIINYNKNSKQQN